MCAWWIYICVFYVNFVIFPIKFSCLVLLPFRLIGLSIFIGPLSFWS